LFIPFDPYDRLALPNRATGDQFHRRLGSDVSTTGCATLQG
jgi:hypothetical protein